MERSTSGTRARVSKGLGLSSEPEVSGKIQGRCCTTPILLPPFHLCYRHSCPWPSAVISIAVLVGEAVGKFLGRTVLCSVNCHSLQRKGIRSSIVFPSWENLQIFHVNSFYNYQENKSERHSCAAGASCCMCCCDNEIQTLHNCRHIVLTCFKGQLRR